MKISYKVTILLFFLLHINFWYSTSADDGAFDSEDAEDGTFDSDDEGFYFFVDNKCSERVWMAIRYYDPDFEMWFNDCWYEIDSDESGYLPSWGHYLINNDWQDKLETTENFYYVYAEDVDQSLLWDGDDWFTTCRGSQVDMKKITYVKQGNLYVKFTCTSKDGLRRKLEVNVMDDVDVDEKKNLRRD